jgi:hypothetical protein
LQEAATRFTHDQLQCLVEKITSTPVADIRLEEMELLNDLIRLNAKHGKTFSTDTSNFFWRVISKSSEAAPEIIDAAVYRFTEIVKHDDQKITILYSCVSNIVNVIINKKRVWRGILYNIFYNNYLYLLHNR